MPDWQCQPRARLRMASLFNHESTRMIFEPDICVPLFVIPSEVENRAAREGARSRGRPEAERVGRERIKSLDISVRL